MSRGQLTNENLQLGFESVEHNYKQLLRVFSYMMHNYHCNIVNTVLQ